MLAGALGTAGAETAADRMKGLEAYCYGREMTFERCISEIVGIDKLDRQRRSGPGGDTITRGVGTYGCSTYCSLRYFPDETLAQCRASIAAFKRATRINRRFARTMQRDCSLIAAAGFELRKAPGNCANSANSANRWPEPLFSFLFYQEP
jgi:hypothetical protein